MGTWVAGSTPLVGVGMGTLAGCTPSQVEEGRGTLVVDSTPSWVAVGCRHCRVVEVSTHKTQAVESSLHARIKTAHKVAVRGPECAEDSAVDLYGLPGGK